MKKAVALIMTIALLLGICATLFVACSMGTNYTISYIVNGQRYAQQKVKSGEQIVFPANPEVPGFTFEGWYLDVDGNEAFRTTHVVSEPAKTYIVVYARLRETGAGAFTTDGYKIEIPAEAVDITEIEMSQALHGLLVSLTSSEYNDAEKKNFRVTSKSIEAVAEDIGGGKMEVAYTKEDTSTSYTVYDTSIDGYIMVHEADSIADRSNVLSRATTTSETTLRGTVVDSANLDIWEGLVQDDEGNYALYNLRSETDPNGQVKKTRKVDIGGVRQNAYSFISIQLLALRAGLSYDTDSSMSAIYNNAANVSVSIFDREGTKSYKKHGDNYYINVDDGNGGVMTLQFSTTAFVSYSQVNYLSAMSFTSIIYNLETTDTTLTMPTNLDEYTE